MSPRRGQPHDHAYEVETLQEKADRIRREQGLPPESQHSGPQPCRWYDDGQGGRYLIPGCIARVNNPDLDECTCKTIEQQLVAARGQITDLTKISRSLQAWNDAIVRAVYDHPDSLKIMKAAADKATPPAPGNTWPPQPKEPTVNTPRRIKRERTRGWTAPLDTHGRKPVYVGRPTRWGNPFVIGTDADDRAHATALYREWLETNSPTVYDPYAGARYLDAMNDRRDWILTHAAKLAGRNLSCWCPLPAPGEPDHCHATVLLNVARDLGGRP